MIQKVIIADASPLIALARIEHFHLLQKLFGEVIITDIVRDEIMAGGHADASPVKVAIKAGWLIVKKIPDSDKPVAESVWLTGLDAGEKSSLQFAVIQDQQNDAVLLIIDEVKGRRAARNLSLELIGSAGIIAVAKRKGLILSAGDLFSELKTSGYYLADSVVEMALKIAGER